MTHTPDRDRYLAGKFAAKQRMARYREWKKKQEKDDEHRPIRSTEREPESDRQSSDKYGRE